MTLHLSTSQYQRMQAALEAAYPQEGCGVLVGRRVFEAMAVISQPDLPVQPTPQDVYREVVQFVPVANAWKPGLLDDDGLADEAHSVGDAEEMDAPNGGDAPSQSVSHGSHDRYWIDPADLLRIQQEARHQDLEIIGIVHSHPDHPAIPSECDRRMAWPIYSYVITSVRGGQVADVQSWRLNDAHQFEPEAIKILDLTPNNPPVMA